MRDPLISIIVPIYGVEKYLNRCVDSILCQTYENLEILLVNDGSKDMCGKIIDVYARNDARVVALHKENGGLSDARNYATKLVHGEFLVYIDGDDWVSPMYIEHLYNAISRENADMAFSWFTKAYEGEEIDYKIQKKLECYELLDTKECLKRLFYQRGIENSAWGKLYRKEMFGLLNYPCGKLYEDIPVTYRMIKRASKIAVISNIDYFYVQRKDSIQNATFNINKMDAIEHMKTVLSDVEKYFPELVPAACCRYFNCVCNILFQVEKRNIDVRKILWKELTKLRLIVLRDSAASKKSKIAALVSFCGYGTMRYLYELVKRI